MTLVNILHRFGFYKRAAKNVVLIAEALIKAKKPCIRQMALSLPTRGQKQSRVNRIWRFLHKMSFKPKIFYSAFVRLVTKKIKSRYIIIDFTSLKGYDISLFIASIPFKGRSIPIFVKVFMKKDLDEVKYLSKNTFIKGCIEELLEILPFKPIIIADREFATSFVFDIFQRYKISFIVRLKKNLVIVFANGKKKHLRDLEPGKYYGWIKDKWMIVSVRENKKDKADPWILGYSHEFVNRNSLHMAQIYLKRSQCEQMHRELKSRLNLLTLNRQKYYKEAYNPEVIEKFLIIFVMAIYIGSLLGKIFIERYKEYAYFIISDKDELSLFGIGVVLFTLNFDFTPKVFRSFRLSLLRGR